MKSKIKSALERISNDKSLPTEEVASYVKDRENKLKRKGEYTRVVPVNTVERLKARDPAFAAAIDATEKHWLTKSNSVLIELLEAVRQKAREPETKLADIAKALDVIATKLDLHSGVPSKSSVVHHMHTIRPEEMDDRAIDAEIIELNSHMGGMLEGSSNGN